MEDQRYTEYAAIEPVNTSHREVDHQSEINITVQMTKMLHLTTIRHCIKSNGYES